MNKLVQTSKIISEMRSLYESNISDPVTMRANDDKANWIFDHFPKYENKTLPRIGVHQAGQGVFENQGIGNINRSELGDIQVSILAKKNKYYDYDDDGNDETPEQLVSHLAKRCKDVVEANQSTLRNLEDVVYVLPDTFNHTPQTSQNLIFHAVTFEEKTEDNLN